MLPLWIIDLNSDRERCRLFQDRLKHVAGALLAVSNIPVRPLSDSDVYDETASKNLLSNQGQWFYSHFDDLFADADFTNEGAMADKLYDFKEKIVREGQTFVGLLRESKVKTDININICVLGHIEEKMSQMTFASVASLIQLEKGRILPNHIHQGVNIMGMLFIPSAVNTRKREDRQNVLRCLREIEVQHEVTSVHGYDKMLYYQDVQNKTQKHYARLNLSQQVDYTTQCIVNLFYATNEFHPLLSGSSSNEHFYLSLGPASIFYDPSQQDSKDLQTVANGLISAFKTEGLGTQKDKTGFVNEKDYDTTKLLCDLFVKGTKELTLEHVEPDEPDPHPVRDYLYKPLKRRYYEGYLSRFPNILMSKITRAVSEQTRSVLESVCIKGKEQLSKFCDVALPTAVKDLISDCNQDTGAIFRIERQLNLLKERIESKERNVDAVIENTVWVDIMERVPRKLQDHFCEYHDEYVEDTENVRKKRSDRGERCASRKKTALNDLINHIKQEPTVLSRFARVFLYGIILVLLIIPILELVSPRYIPLGNITRNSFTWALVIFLIPSLWQLAAHWYYQMRLRFYMTRLKAYYLHDAYARVVNAIRSETVFFYSNAMQLCDEYLKRCEMIRNEVKPIDPENVDWQPAIPKMTFNQPLVDGVFGDAKLFPGDFVDYGKVLVSQKTEFVNKLQIGDYYSLIRVLKDSMYSLFSNVRLQNNERKEDVNTGHMQFLTIKEIRERKANEWRDTLKTFNTDLKANIKRLMVPRRLNTVDAKVLSYAEINDKNAIMEPFINFCATNGELTADNCHEYADVKCYDEKMKGLTQQFLPFNTIYQCDKHQDIYKKFFFLTKWRSFDMIAANRILPETELDLSAKDVTGEVKDELIIDESNKSALPYSSVFLYALCGKDGTASIWLKLFRNEEFAEISDRTLFLNRMKQESSLLHNTLNQLD